ncbi:serine/threonine-protein kinase [Nonomuraea indica]|uniref:serine/threonine-protein kinase n=1 Tax=Nonomuraea indica TaxID=1581193 RepID=UPI001FE262A7|nr:serine/threonine-protein kinase [Nonomuraea indica]
MTSGRIVIDDRFELMERLGSGGMGTVWRAYDLALHREVALKEVRPSNAQDEDPGRARMMRERVLREARALARLDHPNVVTIHHIVDTPAMAHPWIVMELVRGQSLQDRLAQGPLAPGEAALLGRGILAALRTAHEAGILHRDVKPANVLLRPDGSPVLTDFGIAAMQDSPGLTAHGDVVGSPEYIAPERLRGEEGNPASDLWSLGMLLYVAVENRHPMRRDTPIATLAAVLNGQIPPPVRSGPMTPVLNSLLRSEPSARPSAADLDRMLAQAAEQASGMPASGPAQPGMAAPGPMQHGMAAPGSVQHGMAGGPMRPGMPGQAQPGPFHGQGPYGVQGSPTQPPFPGPGKHPGSYPTGPTAASGRRPKARGLTIAGVAAVAGVVTVAFVVVPRLGDRTTPTDQPNPRPTVSADRGTTAPEPSAEETTDEPAPVNLVTPEGVRQVVAALKKASGGDTFISLTVHQEHASAEAPVKGRPKLYDRYTYRNGQVTRDAGGTVSFGDKTVKFDVFDWSVLPKLQRAAEQRLNVDKPTSRYVIVQGAWTFADDQPTILYYLGDEYGVGYLAADRRGKVVRVYAREG